MGGAVVDSEGDLGQHQTETDFRRVLMSAALPPSRGVRGLHKVQSALMELCSSAPGAIRRVLTGDWDHVCPEWMEEETLTPAPALVPGTPTL